MMSPMNLLDKSKVKDAIFAQFWLRVGTFSFIVLNLVRDLYSMVKCRFPSGPMFEEGDKETAVPSLVSFASGVVLELGPGLGSQLPRYNKAKVKKIYGVEPVLALHEPLRQKIKASGLTDIYEVIPCGVEDGAELEKYGIMPGTIDTLLSIQVLCSLPAPEKTMRELYRLLKPGGQLIVYEHVKSTDWLSGLIQGIITSFFRRKPASHRVST